MVATPETKPLEEDKIVTRKVDFSLDLSSQAKHNRKVSAIVLETHHKDGKHTGNLFVWNEKSQTYKADKHIIVHYMSGHIQKRAPSGTTTITETAVRGNNSIDNKESINVSL